MAGSYKVGGKIIKESFSSIMLLLILLAGYIFYRLKIVPLLSEQIQQNYQKYILTIFIISIVLIIQKIIKGVLYWYEDNVCSQRDDHLGNAFIPLLRRVVSVVIWIIAILTILPVYGVNISALVAALGVTSLAISLAAQDTIANMISGFMIMIDRPFMVGNRIKLSSGEVVEVLNIGIRRSQFLAEDKAIVIVPNLDLSKSKIVNYTYGEQRAQ